MDYEILDDMYYNASGNMSYYEDPGLDTLNDMEMYMKRVGYGFGLLFNLISIVVLLRTRHFLEGPNIYLVSIIFVDTFILLTLVLIMLDASTGNRVGNIHFFCILRMNVLLIFHFISYWLVVIYCVFLLRRAHSHPLGRRYSRAASTAYPSCNCPHLGILVAIGFIGLVFYFHIWWMMDGCQLLGMWYSFMGTWREVDRYVNCLLPRLITALLAPPLAVYYCRTRRWMANNDNQTVDQSSRRSFGTDRRKLMEPIVVALPVFITLFGLPRELNLVIFPQPDQYWTLIKLNKLFNLFLEITYISKFFLLVAFSPRFRAALLCCKRRRQSAENASSIRQNQQMSDPQPGPSGPTAV